MELLKIIGIIFFIFLLLIVLTAINSKKGSGEKVDLSSPEEKLREQERLDTHYRRTYGKRRPGESKSLEGILNDIFNGGHGSHD